MVKPIVSFGVDEFLVDLNTARRVQVTANGRVYVYVQLN